VRSNVLNAGIKTARRPASSRCWIDNESNELKPLDTRSRGEQENGEREEDERNSPIEIDGLSLHGEPPFHTRDEQESVFYLPVVAVDPPSL
jgi:hypothetical protein